MRLGLSATPDRWFDEEGTNAIYNYFGPVCVDLGLREALKIGALCEYRYYPILVELTDEEQDEYLELSAKISKAMALADSIEDEDSPLSRLLIKRARLVATAENKVAQLEELMREKTNISNALFYCGDGAMSVGATAEEESRQSRQIEVITQLLGSKLGIRVATYTAETSVTDRKKRLMDLKHGTLQGLVAIKCLDEGVDLPSIDTAVILASSTNPRQFIQRRGRILRKSEGKVQATIYDMVVVPPKQTFTMPSERALMEKELKRLAEFADLAVNPGEARAVVWELQRELGLTDI
jgi:superfamily II DNA or RNA helicase